MHSLLIPNTLTFLLLFMLSIALLYYIVKVAVRNGVEEATYRLTDSVREIEKELKKAKE